MNKKNGKNKILWTIVKLGGLALTGMLIYILFTSVGVMSEHRGALQSVGFTTDSVDKFKVGEYADSVSNKSTSDGTTVVSKFKTRISAISLEPLNERTPEIKKGDTYLIHFTVEFTPLTGNFRLRKGGKDDIGHNLGFVYSNSYEYNVYLEDKDSSKYNSLVPKGQTVNLDFYVKTDEPSTDLGFVLSPDLNNIGRKFLQFDVPDKEKANQLKKDSLKLERKSNKK